MSGTVLITGCSTGIGRATAERFLESGWRVHATARDLDDIEDLQERGCRTHALDVTDSEAVETTTVHILEESGSIDCLVNNAGVIAVSTVEEMSTTELYNLFDVNLFGAHRLMRSIVPHMREQQGGTVINVGSVAGWFPVPAEGAYSASKFGLRALTAALRDELRPFGVDVVLVEPPFVRTRQAEIEMTAATGRKDSPYRELYERFERYAQNETTSALEPSEVAWIIVKAAEAESPNARYPFGLMGRVQEIAGLFPARLRYRLWKWTGSQ